MAVKNIINCIAILKLLLIHLSCSQGGVAENELSVVQYTGIAFSESEVKEKWSVRTFGRSVLLVEILTGRDGNILVIRLENTGETLPLLDSMWYGPEEGGQGIDVIKGRLEIQSWNLEHVISGVVRAELPIDSTLHKRFWVRMGP